MKLTVKKGTKKLKKIYVSDPVYDSEITLLYGGSDKQVAQWLERNNVDVEPVELEGTRGRTYFNGLRSIILILIPMIDSGAITKKAMNTIIHELDHVINRIMNYIGNAHNPEEDEPQAYLIGYYAGEIYSKILQKEKQATKSRKVKK